MYHDGLKRFTSNKTTCILVYCNKSKINFRFQCYLKVYLQKVRQSMTQYLHYIERFKGKLGKTWIHLTILHTIDVRRFSYRFFFFSVSSNGEKVFVPFCQGGRVKRVPVFIGL